MSDEQLNELINALKQKALGNVITTTIENYVRDEKGKEKLSCISLNNIYSKKKYMYKLMTVAPIRIAYDFLWKVKHHFR